LLENKLQGKYNIINNDTNRDINRETKIAKGRWVGEGSNAR